MAMDAQATLRYYRSSPRKVRLVVDLVRGQAVEPALTSLQMCRKYAAPDVAKLVKSALANLEQAQPGVDVDRVFIKTITVDGGPSLKRARPASKWVRSHRILKRTCHITVQLAVREN
jgi:large subunit ribosomal protein L22